MTGNTNSFDDSSVKQSEAIDTARFSRGFVSVSPLSTDGVPTVEVTSIRYPTGVEATVNVNSVGDQILPPEDTSVLLYEADDKDVRIVAILNELSDVQSITVGERVLTHPASDARVYFDETGTLHVDGDTDVIVNGGSTRPVTDVTTTTDGDGHVTSISLERADNFYVPQ